MATRLLKMFVALMTIHVGLAATTVVMDYHVNDDPSYGDSSILSFTPLRSFVSLEHPPGDELREGSTLEVKDVFDFVNHVGDAINGLASFNYGPLNMIGPDDGAVYHVVIAFRVIGALFTIALGLALIYVLFDSGVLSSTLGLGLAAFGAAVTTTVTIVGAAVS